MRIGLWVLGITAVVIPVSGILAVAHATVWRRMGRRHASLLAWVFGGLFFLAVLSNPLINHILFFPLYGDGVGRMLKDLKAEGFVGKSRDELIARFGRADRAESGHGCDEDLYFDCHPWFYWSYPETVVVCVTQKRVVGFAYRH